MSLYLGIDTSNYTTSVAVCGDADVNLRRIIDVKAGQRGIRQSDGVFLHIKELPRLFESLDVDMRDIKAVGVSVKPRNQEGSYMPVFTAGESFARVIAKALSIPLFRASHQDGHIMAGIVSCKATELLTEDFTCVHLSGGTTEILSCKYKNGSFNPQIIGGTKDISAGQLIDRLGVALGMKFPCGKEIDKLSLSSDKIINLKISQNEGFINFSGIETKLLNMVKTEKAEVLARSALLFIGNSINAALSFIKPEKVLFVGGVASNTILRDIFSKQVYKAYFASCELSSDNALGTAHIARMLFEEMI
jgi:N6-L-threonylcarbamoyladenine synthase